MPTGETEQQERVKALTLFLQSEEFRKVAGDLAREQAKEFLYPVSTEDHEAGRKCCEVELRSGEKAMVEIRALPLREALRLRKVFEEGHDLWIFLEAALVLPDKGVRPHPDPLTFRSGHHQEREQITHASSGWDFIDRVTPRCADGLLRVALTLAFGEVDQKKMVAWLNLRRRSISGYGSPWN